MDGAPAGAWAPGSLAQCLFAPRTIALVGASGDPTRASARPQRFLAAHGYPGRVVPVNPSRPEVLGVPAFARVTDIDGPIDHAFVMTATGQVEQALRDCAAHGVPVVTVYSDGFAETGPEGTALQARLAGLARSLGVRLLGPNCIGLINPVDRVALTVNAALKAETPAPGPIAVVSQSGSMLGTLLSRGTARGLGFSRMVSVGNEADLGVGELTDLLVDDPATTTILLFLETLRDAPRLARAARRAHAAGKAVVAYKLGRSALGAALAVSHTGALAGSDAAVDAFLHDAGIVRVEMLDTLLEIAPLLARGPAPARTGPMRVAVVTTTGGGAAMVVDRMGLQGLAPALPTPAFCTAMAAHGVTVRETPIVDLTMAATPARYAAVLQGLLDADFCDAVLAVAGSSAQFEPRIAVDPIVAVAGRAADPARRGAKPVAVFLAPQADASLAVLAGERLAAFRSPEACADALGAFARWSAPAPEPAVEAIASDLAALPAGAGRQVLDEQRSLALFDAVGIPTVARATVAPDTDAAAIDRAAAALGWPLAVKLLSPDLPHKTEAGAVTLGVPDAAQAVDAIRRMGDRARRHRPDARLEGVLLQPMVGGLLEVILGYREDPLVGPVVVVGVGGRLAELYQDVALRLAPVDPAQARAMLDEVRGIAVIRGWRGLPRGDVDALVAAIVAIGRLATLSGRPVAEAEINPLMVRADGVVAVDGLVVLERSAAGPPP
jgi:acyl-CoA synthetase (NDP forming)